MKETEGYIDVDRVCQHTGLAKYTVYQKTNPNKTEREHLLPSYKVGKELRFKLSEVEQWMARHKNRAS